MKFTLEIDCDTAAFGENRAEVSEEVSRILSTAMEAMKGEPLWGNLRDVNGNRVGRWDFDTNR